MSEFGKNIKQYSAEDIKMYIEGRMSPVEMNAFERAAITDPFLADALEGMQLHLKQVPAHSFDSNIADLKLRLDKRIRKKNSISIFNPGQIWWKVAAILIVIIAGISITLLINETNTTQSSELAKKDERSDTANKRGVTNESFILKDSPAIPSPSKSQPSVRSSVPSPEQKSNLKKQSTRRAEAEIANLESQPAAARESQAIDASGDTLVEKTSDSKSDSMSKHEESRQLQGKAVGVDISDHSNHSELNEVVVVGYGSTKKRSSSNNRAEQRIRNRVMPEGGWEKFDKYIVDNKTITTADSTIKGFQKVTFMISDFGRPSSIKMLQSLSKSHDDLVIHLLNNGPDWLIIKGKKRQVTLSLSF